MKNQPPSISPSALHGADFDDVTARPSLEKAGFARQSGRGAEYGVVHLKAGLNSLVKPLAGSGGADLGLVNVLVSSTGITAARAQELIDLGAVYVNQQRIQNPSHPLSHEDEVRAHLEPRRFSISSPLLPRILHRGADHLVVDKPSGLPTHALVDNARENLITLLEKECAPALQIFITHRLDIETSGALILALNREAQARINAAIAAKQIRRLYHAWVEHPVQPGIYTHFMKPSPDAPKLVSIDERPGWKLCRLRVLACDPGDRLLEECSLQISTATLRAKKQIPVAVASETATNGPTDARLRVLHRLVIELETGRSQQIRAQLAQMGAPVVGDASYGSSWRLVDLCTQGAAIGLRAFAVEGLN